jgi:hypothetical protein
MGITVKCHNYIHEGHQAVVYSGNACYYSPEDLISPCPTCKILETIRDLHAYMWVWKLASDAERMDVEECSFLGCNVVYFRDSPTFLRNKSPPSSR